MATASELPPADIAPDALPSLVAARQSLQYVRVSGASAGSSPTTCAHSCTASFKFERAGCTPLTAEPYAGPDADSPPPAALPDKQAAPPCITAVPRELPRHAHPHGSALAQRISEHVRSCGASRRPGLKGVFAAAPLPPARTLPPLGGLRSYEEELAVEILRHGVGVDMDEPDQGGYTPLLYAADAGA